MVFFKDYNIRSNFLKNLIKNTNFKDKKKVYYIMELTSLEKSISRGIIGCAHDFLIKSLKQKYEFEYFQMLKELDEKKYQKLLKEREKELLKIEKKLKDNNSKDKKKESNDTIEDELFNWWKKNGGKI